MSGPESKGIVSARWVGQASNTDAEQRTAYPRGERGGAMVVEGRELAVMVDSVGDGGLQ